MLLAVVVAQLSAPPSPLAAAKQAVLAADKDKDGSMNRLEFGLAMEKNPDFRRAVFSALDNDADGLLDAEPFQALEKEEVTKPTPAKVAAEQTPLEAARAAVIAGDKDGDDMLNKREFASQIVTNSALRRAVFGALDRDQDGKLDAEPFQALEKEEEEEEEEKEEEAPKLLPNKRVSGIFREADRDGDSRLSEAEARRFVALMQDGDAEEEASCTSFKNDQAGCDSQGLKCCYFNSGACLNCKTNYGL